jgi:N-acetylmuramoyl-L-alanine amidase
VGRVFVVAKVAALAALGGLGWVGGRALKHERAAEAWPDVVALTLLPPPATGPKMRVVIDPGHGAQNNTGNRSSFCRDEQDFTLDLGRDVKRELEATGRFEVRLSRDGEERVDYRTRIEAAARWGASAFVSLHSDVRGQAETWRPSDDLECPRHRGGTGFAVLFSDENPGLNHEALASRIATQMSNAGFVPFAGVAYAADYAPRATSGVFADRHALESRIFVLRASHIPAVIVETHNALDDREALIWEDPVTRRAFARAVARALAGT